MSREPATEWPDYEGKGLLDRSEAEDTRKWLDVFRAFATAAVARARSSSIDGHWRRARDALCGLGGPPQPEAQRRLWRPPSAGHRTDTNTTPDAGNRADYRTRAGADQAAAHRALSGIIGVREGGGHRHQPSAEHRADSRFALLSAQRAVLPTGTSGAESSYGRELQKAASPGYFAVHPTPYARNTCSRARFASKTPLILSNQTPPPSIWRLVGSLPDCKYPQCH